MTIPDDFFGANCQGNGSIHAQRAESCSTGWCKARDANTAPAKMISPALSSGVKERHGPSGLWICSRSRAPFRREHETQARARLSSAVFPAQHLGAT